MRKEIEKEIINYNPSIDDGLSFEQVEERKASGLTNKNKTVVGKSYWEIIYTNVFSFFNILLFVIAGFMIYAAHYSGLFFLFVLIPNIIIGLYQDIKAKKLLGKLRLMTQPMAKVIRNSETTEISSEDVVLDDVIQLNSGSQIVTDGVVVYGNLSVNESLLTGESRSITKQVGDKLFAGSFVVSGSAKMQATSIGDMNYIASIQKSANAFKRSPSKILKSLKGLFGVLGIIVITIGIATLVVYGIQGSLSSESQIKSSIANIAGSMVSMIPSGLYLLTSMALATAVVALSKKKAQVQDFYSVEMLARVDCLCVDKTGTITDGTMEFKKMIVLDDKSEEDVKQIISNVLIATDDHNFTAGALRKYFDYELTSGIVKSLPFSSDIKCSGASFKGGKTYILGAPEFLNIKNKQGVLNIVSEYTKLGFRVLVLAETNKLVGEHLSSELKSVAIIVLQDHIKDDAVDTFRWFTENGVNIKVISGDNASTVSEVARQAGIPDSSNYISLEGMDIETVKSIATKYTVFGRVTPEQKEAIVMALKNDGKTVAMTGDGVNDILALKRADCSIAMASGADAARNVSHIVLLDSNFARLPDVVAEGRRVVNNLQRTCSVFLVKTTFAILVSLAFLIASICLNEPSIKYEFLTNNLYLWEIFGIGLPAFFLALQKSNEQIKGSFIKNILKKALPAGITVVLSVAIVYVLFILHSSNVVYTGVTSSELNPFRSDIATTMCILIFTLFSLVVLYKVCSPLDKYRGIVFGSATTFVVGLLVGAYFQELLTGENIFLINFSSMELINYVEAAFILIAMSTFYLTILYIIEVLKGEHLNDKN